MSDSATIDYGPLAALLGVWHGDNGLDVAPEPDGTEYNPYYETLTFSAIGDISNADTQILAAVHYQQEVREKANHELSHHQCGYWLWDAKCQTLINSFVIPRGVSVIAGGHYNAADNTSGALVLNVTAAQDDRDWKITQAAFMLKNARTTHFQQQLTVTGDKLSYTQTMMLDIYGKHFEHTDRNDLLRQ